MGLGCLSKACGLGAQGSGEGLGLGFRVSDLGFRVWGCRVQGLGFRAEVPLKFRVEVGGLRASGCLAVLGAQRLKRVWSEAVEVFTAVVQL